MPNIETLKLTVDVIVRLWKADYLRGVVLIERRKPPKGLALPGGFVEIGETVETVAVHEVKKEIGVDVGLACLLDVYSESKRDPRFHTAAAVLVGDSDDEPQAVRDTREALASPFEEIPLDLPVFDHWEIILDFLERSRDENGT